MVLAASDFDGNGVSSDGRPVKRKGCAVYRQLGEQLIGGWASVYVDGWQEPSYAEVSLDEYDQGFALWKTKKATMIRKVAVSQALREAFPLDFGGLYEPEEMGLDPEEVKAPEQEYEAPEEPMAYAEEGF